MNFSESGWLFENPEDNIIRDVDDSDILDLFRLAVEEEETWVKNINANAREMATNLASPLNQNFFVHLVTISNSEKALLPTPFGYMLTVSSRKHLFRGEREIYPCPAIPSMNRKCVVAGYDKSKTLLAYAVAQLRIELFTELLWKFNLFPAWEATISEVNYKALAQHYGFDTCLLDLTNDARIAILFATCKFDNVTNTFSPLTENDIKAKPGETDYGLIYVSPDWCKDFNNGGGTMNLMQRIAGLPKEGFIDPESGYLDGIAFQIGYQPMMRCSEQCGYIYPMRNTSTISPYDDYLFEKLRFKQSTELSHKIYEMTDHGKIAAPYEGISKAMDVVEEIRKKTVFSRKLVTAVYDNDISLRNTYAIPDTLMADLDGFVLYDGTDKNTISVVEEDEEIVLSDDVFAEINEMYSVEKAADRIGDLIKETPEARAWRDKRYRELYGN